MQYSITLPANYDMSIIRHRVATRGHLMDGFAGLGFKAYLIRTVADGSAVNQYAPFYVWNDVAGMGKFLWGGGGFQGIVRDFGRPVVRHWTGVAVEFGSGDVARSASRTVTPIPEGVDLTEFVAEAVQPLGELADSESVYATVAGVDPDRWELVHFTVWSDTAPGRYEVLHISQGT
ncbi:DUF4865 family protein [Kibdelosporangium philippinense]|uniref:DUF4865 family protein n=1 Tax=Kibdelosporangium philippinense TaxID=211113 RepID=A0ABS8ZHG1_9PSEU|nr:DUF4865 family protein [Kibdelosporangium philippinense]MCE7007249.1 DUF4865 family protein [Kibdelosporangium philippinense]